MQLEQFWLLPCLFLGLQEILRISAAAFFPARSQVSSVCLGFFRLGNKSGTNEEEEERSEGWVGLGKGRGEGGAKGVERGRVRNEGEKRGKGIGQSKNIC